MLKITWGLVMISSQFLIVAGIMTALIWVPAGIRLYKMAVPLHWLFAIPFALGSLGISFFYFEIEYGLIFGVNRIVLSRWLWAFVEGATFMLGVSILVYRR